MTETPALVTERLRLRRLRADDAEALHPTLADAELMHWWSSAPHTSVEQTRAYFAERVPRDDGWRCWAITLADNDAAIGWIAAGEKRQRGVTEIGYILARAHWGSGIAREAVAAVIDRLFAEGQRRVFADTDPENAPSLALLDRLGFRREGYLRREWETHLGVRDSVILGLLKEEWHRG